MADLIEARWLPGYPVDLPNGTRVGPGETAFITAGEAAQSDHWEPVKPPVKPKQES